jgi:hypothetical protein
MITCLYDFLLDNLDLSKILHNGNLQEFSFLFINH